MSQKLNSEIVTLGIDIGKNSFHLVGRAEPWCCGKSGRVAKRKPGSRICRRA